MASSSRDNSLELELKNEDATMAAGKSSKERRDEAKKNKEREREEQKLADSMRLMYNAGKQSKEKRNKK